VILATEALEQHRRNQKIYPQITLIFADYLIHLDLSRESNTNSTKKMRHQDDFL